MKEKGRRAEHARKMQSRAPSPSAAQDARLGEATRAGAPSQTFSLHSPPYSFANRNAPPIFSSAAHPATRHCFLRLYHHFEPQLCLSRDTLDNAHPAHRHPLAHLTCSLLLVHSFTSPSQKRCNLSLRAVAFHSLSPMDNRENLWTRRSKYAVGPHMQVAKANRAPALASSLCLCRTQNNRTRKPTIPSVPSLRRSDLVATRRMVAGIPSTVSLH